MNISTSKKFKKSIPEKVLSFEGWRGVVEFLSSCKDLCCLFLTIKGIKVQVELFPYCARHVLFVCYRWPNKKVSYVSRLEMGRNLVCREILTNQYWRQVTNVFPGLSELIIKSRNSVELPLPQNGTPDVSNLYGLKSLTLENVVFKGNPEPNFGAFPEMNFLSLNKEGFLENFDGNALKLEKLEELRLVDRVDEENLGNSVNLFHTVRRFSNFGKMKRLMISVSSRSELWKFPTPPRKNNPYLSPNSPITSPVRPKTWTEEKGRKIMMKHRERGMTKRIENLPLLEELDVFAYSPYMFPTLIIGPMKTLKILRVQSTMRECNFDELGRVELDRNLILSKLEVLDLSEILCRKLPISTSHGQRFIHPCEILVRHSMLNQGCPMLKVLKLDLVTKHDVDVNSFQFSHSMVEIMDLKLNFSQMTTSVGKKKKRGMLDSFHIKCQKLKLLKIEGNQDLGSLTITKKKFDIDYLDIDLKSEIHDRLDITEFCSIRNFTYLPPLAGSRYRERIANFVLCDRIMKNIRTLKTNRWFGNDVLAPIHIPKFEKLEVLHLTSNVFSHLGRTRAKIDDYSGIRNEMSRHFPNFPNLKVLKSCRSHFDRFDSPQFRVIQDFDYGKNRNLFILKEIEMVHQPFLQEFRPQFLPNLEKLDFFPVVDCKRLVGFENLKRIVIRQYLNFGRREMNNGRFDRRGKREFKMRSRHKRYNFGGKVVLDKLESLKEVTVVGRDGCQILYPEHVIQEKELYGSVSKNVKFRVEENVRFQRILNWIKEESAQYGFPNQYQRLTFDSDKCKTTFGVITTKFS